MKTGTKTSDVEYVKINPERARELLTSNLPIEQGQVLVQERVPANVIARELNRSVIRYNRLVSTELYLRYARDMRRDHWKHDGQPLRIDTDNHLRDGAHRMLAVIESGKTLEFLVVRNLEPDTFFTMDTGRKRSTADQLSVLGVRSAVNTTSAANLLLRWRAGRVTLSDNPTATEVREFIEKSPHFKDSIDDALRVRRALPRAPVSVFGAALHEAGELDADQCAELVELLVTGDIPGTWHPIARLRNVIIQYDTPAGRRFKQWQRLWHVVRTWNAWRDNQELRNLLTPVSMDAGKFPTMR